MQPEVPLRRPANFIPMDLSVAEQGAFCLTPVVSPEEARGRAAGHKGSAFGTIAQVFSRPKPEEIELEELGLRYEPMWNASCHVKVAFQRKESYKLPVKSPPHVQSVTIHDQQYQIDVKEQAITLPAIAHCMRESSKEIWIDAVTNEAVKNFAVYVKATKSAITGDFAPENAQVVAPTVRASAVIRDLLGDDIKPVEADSVQEETVEVKNIDLYLRPVYAYRYNWAAKKKTAEISLDGISGEISATKSAAQAALMKLLNKDTLFDIGAETMNLVLPGGAIPIRIVEAFTRGKGPA